MTDPYVDAGCTILQSDYADLDIYSRGRVRVISMKKSKGDRKAFRVASNNLDPGLINELHRAFESFEDDPKVDAIVLASGHLVVFSRGAKIELMAEASREDCRTFIRRAQELVLRVQRHPKPVIASIHGLAFGGGLELAMGCDYRYTGDRDTIFMGLPEARLGIIPGMGGTQNLRRLVGVEKAREIVIHARTDIEPTEAEKIGLVDRVCAQEELVREVLALAESGTAKKRFVFPSEPAPDEATIAAEVDMVFRGEMGEAPVSPHGPVAPFSAHFADFIYHQTKPEAYLEGLAFEREIVCALQGTVDFQEGVKALEEEREPRFKGE